MDKYLMIGLCTVFVVVLFFCFSEDGMTDPAYSGIAYDVHESKNGSSFSFDASDGTVMRCFYKGDVVQLGYYSLTGDFSDDGTIYFVKTMERLDKV